MPNDRPRVRAVTRGSIAMSCVAVLVSMLLAPSSARADRLAADDPLARELVAHERAAWDKYARRDLEGSRPLLAGDYADVQGDGSVLDREAHLAFVPQANVEWHELDRFHVIRLAPDAALVTYRARARDRGADEVYQADVTSGWSRRKGRWLNTFYRETPTAPERASSPAPP
jgi:glyoxylase I family protein